MRPPIRMRTACLVLGILTLLSYYVYFWNDITQEPTFSTDQPIASFRSRGRSINNLTTIYPPCKKVGRSLRRWLGKEIRGLHFGNRYVWQYTTYSAVVLLE